LVVGHIGDELVDVGVIERIDVAYIMRIAHHVLAKPIKCEILE
jgi:3-deoxy-D-manno-octulosonate 8-phosphate phosphatase KdsC-like HAD superfamily phosphatase